MNNVYFKFKSIILLSNSFTLHLRMNSIEETVTRCSICFPSPLLNSGRDIQIVNPFHKQRDIWSWKSMKQNSIDQTRSMFDHHQAALDEMNIQSSIDYYQVCSHQISVLKYYLDVIRLSTNNRSLKEFISMDNNIQICNSLLSFFVSFFNELFQLCQYVYLPYHTFYSQVDEQQKQSLDPNPTEQIVFLMKNQWTL